MKHLLKKVWGLWQDIDEMAEDLTDTANRLKRQRDAGELPDARHDRTILIRARALGRRITLGDLEAFRKAPPRMSMEERREIIGAFVKQVGGYKAIAERTGTSQTTHRISKTRGYLGRLYRHEYLTMAREVGAELPPEIFETPSN
jgi:hypothetical protein